MSFTFGMLVQVQGLSADRHTTGVIGCTKLKLDSVYPKTQVTYIYSREMQQ
jgi:hypothetical protein